MGGLADVDVDDVVVVAVVVDVDDREFIKCFVKDSASRMAWLAPLLPMGYMGCAASPSKVSRPKVHLAMGSRSHMGYSNTFSVFSINSGTFRKPNVQSWNSFAKRSLGTDINQSPDLTGGVVSGSFSSRTRNSAIQFTMDLVWASV